MAVILMVVALVLFLLAAFAWPPTGRVSLGWLGLAFLVLAELWGPLLTAASR